MNWFFRSLRTVLPLLPVAACAFMDTASDDLFGDLGGFTPSPVAPVAGQHSPAPASPPLVHPTPAPAPAPEPAADFPAPPEPVPMPDPAPIQPMQPDRAVQPLVAQPTPALPPSVQAAPAEPASPRPPLNLVRQGTERLHQGDLDAAQALFEAALHNNPYDLPAMKQLRYTAALRAKRETRSTASTRERMLADVQAAWNTPRAQGEPLADHERPRDPSESEQRAAALRAKLESLHIAAIAFQNAPIQQVVLELSAMCRTIDPDQTGVNLVVYGTDVFPPPPITFSASDLSALDVLDIITRMTGMKYDLDHRLVTLTPVHYEPPQQMVTAEFDLLPSVGMKMAAMAEPDRGGLLDVRGFFSTVPFPPESSARYNPAFDLLLVRNSPKHMEQIARLIDLFTRRAIEERSRQVEIEIKFIEVSQGALNELGFEWTLGTPGKPVTSDPWTLPGGQKLFTDTLRSGSSAFSREFAPAGRPASFNTYAVPTPNPLGGGLIDPAGELLIRKVRGDLRADLLIRALERTAGSDLLSAPRILTRSGETASIHIGEIHWYPSAYDVALERYAQPSLVPVDYQEERTGVMLEVTPELDPETGTINLTLAPEIRELAGFTEQHVGTIWPEFGSENLTIYRDAPSAVGPYSDKVINFLTARENNRTIYADRLIARRPVFRTRKISTRVTIEDGSTLAMGGLIKEHLETFQDRVPILGQIPLVGRLFRSEGERTVKRNLLIFVTAHQVDASGHRTASR